jgi:hypothetical protein
VLAVQDMEATGNVRLAQEIEFQALDGRELEHDV